MGSVSKPVVHLKEKGAGLQGLKFIVGKRMISKMKGLILGSMALLLFLAVTWDQSLADTGKEIAEFRDDEYGFVFQFPAHWQVQNPDGEREMGKTRVVVQGPDRSVLTAFVEKQESPLKREMFEANPDRRALIKAYINQILDRIYRKISKESEATRMIINKEKVYTSKIGIRFTIHTAHLFHQGRPMLVNGIHTFPFDKDYMVSFLMKTWVGRKSPEERERLTRIFNSFHFLQERMPSTHSYIP
jgi:hypothetical protein